MLQFTWKPVNFFGCVCRLLKDFVRCLLLLSILTQHPTFFHIVSQSLSLSPPHPLKLEIFLLKDIFLSEDENLGVTTQHFNKYIVCALIRSLTHISVT